MRVAISALTLFSVLVGAPDRAAAATIPTHVIVAPVAVSAMQTSSFELIQHLVELCQGGTCSTSTPGFVRSLDWRVGVRERATGAVTQISSDASTADVDVWFTWSGIMVRWSNIVNPALPPGVDLDVRTRFGWAGDPFLVALRFWVDLEGPAVDDYSIQQVEFPIVEVNAAPDDALAWPLGTGIVMKNAPTHPVVQIFGDFTQHPGSGSMQWWSLYPGEGAPWHPSFYMSTRDDDGIWKAYIPEPVADGVRFTVRTIPPDSHTATSYQIPFDTVLGLTSGDWYDAASRYRNWAECQDWTHDGRIDQDDDYSATIRDMDMFGLFSPDTDFQSWDPWPARHAEQTALFNTPNIVPQNYGWYPRAFNVNFGDWAPRADFVTIAGGLAAQGVRFSPYTLLHLITFGAEPDVPGYAPGTIGDQYGLRNETGGLVPRQDAGALPAFEVCLSTPFAKDYFVWLAQRLDGYGAGGQYVDNLNALAPQRCYSTTHGHAAPDPEATQRRLEIIAAVKAAVSDPEYYLSSESVSEAYLGAVDLGMSQWTKNTLGTAVDYFPLFETVYNPYLRIGRLGVVLNFVSAKLPPPVFQLLSRQTYAADIFWGRVPFAGALLNPDSLTDNALASPIWALFIDFVASSVGILTDDDVVDHVTYGERLRDPVVNVAKVDLAFLGPLLQLLTLPYDTEQPALYTSAWGNPGKGSVLVMIQNWTDPLDDLLFVNTVTAQMESTAPVTTMKAEDLGFDPACFEEYGLEAMDPETAACLATECMPSVLEFHGGPQTYSFQYSPSSNGYWSHKWKLFHITASGTTDLGKVSGYQPVNLSGTIPARATEAYLLVPSYH